MIGEICQPLASNRTVELENLGVSYTADTLKSWRRSPSAQLERSRPRSPGTIEIQTGHRQLRVRNIADAQWDQV